MILGSDVTVVLAGNAIAPQFAAYRRGRRRSLSEENVCGSWLRWCDAVGGLGGCRQAFRFGLVVEPEASYSPWPFANPTDCASRLNSRGKSEDSDRGTVAYIDDLDFPVLASAVDLVALDDCLGEGA
jgi:hypothetical protein